MRYLTAGESHGPAIVAVLDGFPAGVRIETAAIARSLARRRTAPGRSPRQAEETDSCRVLGGLHRGETTGAPVAVVIDNAVRIDEIDDSAVPRPGHADFAGMLKYGLAAPAVVRERASARETVARVALGAFCLRLLGLLDIRVSSRVVALGGRTGAGQTAMIRELERARKSGESLGGVFEVRAENLPVGLGSHVQWDRRLSSRLAAQLMGLNAVKGVEFGAGFALAALRGTASLDLFKKGRNFERESNLAGGLEGGMTDGAPLIIRAAVRPVPGQGVPVRSVDMRTGRPAQARPGRSDLTAVFAAAVVAEHVTAFELADAILEKFGGDSLRELAPRLVAWRAKTQRPPRR